MKNMYFVSLSSNQTEIQYYYGSDLKIEIESNQILFYL